MNDLHRQYLLWILLWAVAAIPAILMYPLTPIDETRYAAVAWEMAVRGDYLVPYLNGETYSHKPPLVFWLLQAGWMIFGLNDWWPRLLPALFALVSMYLTHRIGLYLWPDRNGISLTAPVLLIGTFLWLFFIPALMFDIILCAWVLLATLGLLQAYFHGARRGWLLFLTAVTLGILTKGPVMVLHVLIPGLLVPVFLNKTAQTSVWSWYHSLILTIVGAIAAVSLWAVPAALLGGEEYAKAILWKQSSGRLVDAFDHQAGWWWYLPWLPLILFPWFWWPAMWRAFKLLGWKQLDSSSRFCIGWAVLVFLIFSLISGKRAHYLMPMLPVLSLVGARAIDSLPSGRHRLDGVPIAAVLVMVALVFLIAPNLQSGQEWPEWVAQIPHSVVIVPLLAAAWLLVMPRFLIASAQHARWISGAVVLTHSLVLVQLLGVAKPYYDVHPISNYLRESERKGFPIAHVGKYHGQYSFYGRLTKPVKILDREEVTAWSAAHPDGRIISYRNDPHDWDGYRPMLIAPYRSKWTGILSAAEITGDVALQPVSH